MKLFKFKKKQSQSLLSKIKAGEYTISEIREMLPIISINDLHEIGVAIINTDYDGYNRASIKSSIAYFDNLKRWQKEFFIKERTYELIQIIKEKVNY